MKGNGGGMVVFTNEMTVWRIISPGPHLLVYLKYPIQYYTL